MAGEGSRSRLTWVVAFSILPGVLASIVGMLIVKNDRLRAEAGLWKRRAEEAAKRSPEVRPETAVPTVRVLNVKPHCGLGQSGETLIVHTEMRSNLPFVGAFQGTHGLFHVMCGIHTKTCDGFAFLDLQATRRETRVLLGDVSRPRRATRIHE